MVGNSRTALSSYRTSKWWGHEALRRPAARDGPQHLRTAMTEARDHMRIGIVSGEYPPQQGGVGDFTALLAEELAVLGHDSHIITGPAPHAGAGQPGVTVHRLRTSWRWGCWGKILRLVEALGLDVLNVQYQAAAYSMRAGINLVPGAGHRPPVAVTFHDLRVPYLFPKAGRLRRQAVTALARRADGVIATNEEDYACLQRHPDPASLALIPIGATIKQALPPGYDREAERAKWGAAPDDILLGHFGFLNESKGAEELLQATRTLVDQGLPVRLLMIGGRLGSSDPTNRRQAAVVEELINHLGLRKHIGWTGHLPRVETSAALAATDVCVLPYRDGASFRRTTLLACLAHGRAVITARPAVRLDELGDGDNVLLVEPRQPAALAEAIAHVAGDPQLRARLESGARRLADQFSWERIGRETATYLEGIRGGTE